MSHRLHHSTICYPVRRRPARAGSAVLVLTLVIVASITTGHHAAAEGEWKPFAERDAAPKRSRSAVPGDPSRPLLAPMGSTGGDGVATTPTAELSTASPNGAYLPPTSANAPSPFSASANSVERGDLAPVMSNDGSGLPLDLWNGLDIASIEGQLAKLDIPPRSPAVNGLWRRLLQSEAAPASSAVARFHALRAEALLRSGLLAEQSDALSRAVSTSEADNAAAVLVVMKARSDIALGKRDVGCAAIKNVDTSKTDVPKRIRGDIIVLSGYCAAVGGNTAAAGLAADLAREERHEAPTAIAALDAIALGSKATAAAKIILAKRLDAVDWRLLALSGPPDAGGILERADPSLLAVLVTDGAIDAKLRLAAAEVAARVNVVTPDRLAEIYRAQSFTAADLADPLAGRPDPLLRRALLFKSADAERTPQKKARTLRALLDDARRNGLYLPMLRASATMIAGIPRAVEIGWFAETGIEAMVAAERIGDARTWLAFAQTLDRPTGATPSNGGLQHWAALIDIADPNTSARRGDSLASVEQMALAGRFNSDMLHRLATVLDALDYQVPIPLWEAASKTPQPSTGHLPETGVLTELQDAAKKKQFGRTVLLTLRALGPNAAEGAHMIALGDAIRALKRVGLEPDARRLGFEALFASWPRSASN